MAHQFINWHKVTVDCTQMHQLTSEATVDGTSVYQLASEVTVDDISVYQLAPKVTVDGTLSVSTGVRGDS
jgi:phage baseplate assembly protein gpV